MSHLLLARHPRRVFCLASFLVAGVVATAADSARVRADDSWPQFLGPTRTGISTETGLIDAWPEGGVPEVWRVKGGVGMSGMAVAGGRLVTMIQDAAGQHVIALDAATGTSVWRTTIAPEYKNQMGNGPRATPTIDGDTVFAYSGEGILVAMNFAGGHELWRHHAVMEAGGKTSDYGMSCSPLVAGDLVVVAAGGPQATMVAYDAKSGKHAWSAGGGPAGYSSPALLELGGVQQIVALCGAEVLGIVPRTGEVLWNYDYETEYECNIATPLAIDGNVFISAGENHGCVMLKPRPGDTGWTVEEVWSSLGNRSVLRNEWQTSALVDGYLYGLDNVGSAGPVTHLACVKAATGERAWWQPRFGKSNLIAADGKLFFTTMKGELVVVRANPQAYEELGRAVVIGTTRQAPALVGGRLYLRDDAEIVCLKVATSD